MLKRTMLAALALCAVATPAHAANVRIYLALSAGTYAPTGQVCALDVAQNADGIAVLDAAVAKHCIVSYATVSFGEFGTFVTCIDEVCGNAGTGTIGTYWNMYENGTSTGYGVDGFVADDNDELGFAYRAFCFEAVCPPV